MSIAARLSSKDLNGNADIQVTDPNLQALGNYLAPATALNLESSRGNLRIGLEIDRGKTLHGKIQASLPSLTIQHAEKKSSLKGITMRGLFQTEGDKATHFPC